MPFVYGTPEWEENYKKMVQERMTTQPRPFVYFSPEWIGEWEKFLQKDAKYKEAAKDWEGVVVLHMLKNPDFGVDQDFYIWMDLWHGDCRSIRPVPPEVGKKGDYLISGTVERWLSVGRKQLDPIKGMMQGKLKLKGDLPTIVRAVKAALRLVESSAELGGQFQDELSPEGIAKFRSTLSELSTKFGIN